MQQPWTLPQQQVWELTSDLEQIQQSHQGIDQPQRQDKVQVIQPITHVEGWTLHSIQGAVPPTKYIIAYKVPQGELQFNHR